MLVVHARLTVDPGRVAEFEALARELWQATHALEAGCRRYEYMRLPERGRYLTIMLFDGYDAFLAHQASDHHLGIAGGPMRELIRSVDIEFGLPVDGAFGHPDVGQRGPLVIDADTRDYYGNRYPAPDFSGWDP